MKLLFDENLSARLVALLQADHPSSAHVEQLLGRGHSDVEVWEYARARLTTLPACGARVKARQRGTDLA